MNTRQMVLRSNTMYNVRTISQTGKFVQLTGGASRVPDMGLLVSKNTDGILIQLSPSIGARTENTYLVSIIDPAAYR